MLTLSLIIIITGVGRWININRMTMIVYMYSAIISIHMTEMEIINSGIGIYNSLYVVTPISQYIETTINILAYGTMVIGCIKERARSEYSIIALIVTIGMSSLISSNEIISILIGIELQTLGLYVIASLYRGSERSTAAGLKYYLLGGLSSCIIGLGFAMIYGISGVTNIEELNIIIKINNNINISVPMIFIIVGLLFKIGAAPFHNWLADVIDGVPTIISTWLAVVSKISIMIIIFILYNNIIIDMALVSNSIIMTIIISLIVGSSVGVIQSRIKRLLAYSSIAHAGYILIGIIINDNIGVTGLIFYIVQYTLTVLNIFIIIIAYSDVTCKPIEYISQLKGIHNRNPLLAISIGISLLSSAGEVCLRIIYKMLKDPRRELAGKTLETKCKGTRVCQEIVQIKLKLQKDKKLLESVKLEYFTFENNNKKLWNRKDLSIRILFSRIDSSNKKYTNRYNI